MNVYKEQYRSFFLYFLSVLALLIYCNGFFSLKCSPSDTFDSGGYSEKKNYSLPRVVDKLALIIIDALRLDFVIPEYMPFTSSLISNNNSCFIKTKAYSPTVTMPRLKAITSGKISSYVDVVLNFMSSDIKEDNFIDKAVSQGLHIVFYGDDTWLKLFPNAFMRSEGTNSFFTLDYTEVDDNVTRHLDIEFGRSDWDIIILHYLGLDHIGHTEGPKSPLIKLKLQEMDDVVKKFFDHFKALEESTSLKTRLIVTSDHGMKDSGSHGGVSYPEVTVPLISVGKPCAFLPGWPEEDVPLQIDIAPSVSAILGLLPPANNMGKLIPHLLNEMQTDQIIEYLELNRLQLDKFFRESNGVFNVKETKLEDWKYNATRNGEDKTVEKYFHCLNKFSQELVMSHSDFKLSYLILGVALFWIFLIILLYHGVKQCRKPRKLSQWFFIFGTVSHAVSFGSTSFIEEEHQTWYFLWITLCIALLLETVYLKISNIQKCKFLLVWFVLSCTHRFLRKLNQTGDKWAFLPDFKSFLNSPEGESWLFVLFLIGIGMLFWFAVSEGCSPFQLLPFVVSLLAVICFRIATQSFHFQYLAFYPSSRGVSEVLLFWSFMGIFAIQSFYYKTPVYLIWLLLASLLMRPHNVILLPLEVLTSRLIHKFFHGPDNLVWNNLAHVWLGNLFYFYQGNGNSIANLDVASGFVGTKEYSIIYAGIMMAAHTSSGYILSYMLSPKSNLVYAVTRLIPLTLFCTFQFFQLHHLFIWSVFSPKLLYEANMTTVFLILMFFTTFSSFINSDTKRNTVFSNREEKLI